MDWSSYLSSHRLATSSGGYDPDRSPFDADADRILFSSAFRRLQDKTQVHGPIGNDYVRNRLTHSMEVSRVARTLGVIAGRRLAEAGHSANGQPVNPQEIGNIVAAAALAHDLGNPPFGHEGEDAISSWFDNSPLGQCVVEDISPRFRAEIADFDGNAQGFRILTRLQGWRVEGGMQLTHATLAAFTKYPHAADCAEAAGAKKGKYGFFASEAELFRKVATGAGMAEIVPDVWRRHPLAHLVEAADDICYRIVDVEDAVMLDILPFEEAEALLKPVVGENSSGQGPCHEEVRWSEYTAIREPARKLEWLRSKAITRLVRDTAEVFVNDIDQILAGEIKGNLLFTLEIKDHLGHIEKISRQRIYKARGGSKAMNFDILAINTIETLLTAYCDAFLERERFGMDRVSRKNRTLLKNFPGAEQISNDRETWLRAVLDWVSGCTDSYAIERARLLQAP